MKNNNKHYLITFLSLIIFRFLKGKDEFAYNLFDDVFFTIFPPLLGGAIISIIIFLFNGKKNFSKIFMISVIVLLIGNLIGSTALESRM